MARKGMIKGMPSSFPTTSPECNSCILRKQTKSPVPKMQEVGNGHRAVLYSPPHTPPDSSGLHIIHQTPPGFHWSPVCHILSHTGLQWSLVDYVESGRVHWSPLESSGVWQSLADSIRLYFIYAGIPSKLQYFTVPHKPCSDAESSQLSPGKCKNCTGVRIPQLYKNDNLIHVTEEKKRERQTVKCLKKKQGKRKGNKKRRASTGEK
ncbi:hypothetical protein BYT27DRAFT_7117684 [Phlegmacium glaucopus]|nr:hypothetical protein BYT27DRAFT_7117684 [Phlegmacium glaucopus]